MDNRYKELKKNTIIIAIANLGSKIIVFLLAPLYSYYMSTSQYGSMDLINSTIGLIMPFICLDVFEATFRYSNDSAYDKKRVLSTSIIVGIPGTVICFLFLFWVYCFPVGFSIKYWLLLCLSVAFGAINLILAQFLRGSNKMIRFALSGIISSVVLLVANYVFLVILNTGLEGWIISYFISKLIETIYLLVSSNISKFFGIKFFDKKYAHEFLVFCLPLMPTATMWWIMNLSDRYMLAFIIGTSATGIYAVANKIPGLLSVFENIFYQAWQTTAIDNLENENRDAMYSNVFNNYFTILSLGVIGILFLGRPVINLLFEKSFSEAWLYIPILVLGVVVHALSGNLGSLYSVFKDTKGALFSTFCGALTNILLNLLFIPVIGIWGAAISTVIGYLVTLVYRWFDTKRFVIIGLNRKSVIGYMILLIIQFFLYYQPGTCSYIFRMVILAIVILINKNLLLSIVKRK